MKRLYTHRTYRPIVFLAVIALLMTALVGVQAQNTGNAPDECEPFMPLGWTQYAVRRGDTLSGIALKHNATMTQLQYVNCLQTRSQLQIGQTLYVPVRKNADHEPFNFALQCDNQGYESDDCIRMMNMLGEENGNTLRTRCRDEGLDDTTCRWMQTMAQEESGNGLMTRCYSANYDADTCYRMMLALGQDNAEDILEACMEDDADQANCQWMMTHMYRHQNNAQDDVDALDADLLQDRDKDRDQTRDQTRDQDCDQDCEPDQDHDRDQDRDRDQDHDGTGTGGGTGGGSDDSGGTGGSGGNPPDDSGKGRGN